MIFLSSHDTQMDIVMTMNMGGDDYIQKPFHMDVLIAKINALLRRTYSYMETQSQTMEHDGIILNLENGEVLHGDRKSELTKTDRKSTRLNSSHVAISYAVFCLKKKIKQ